MNIEDILIEDPFSLGGANLLKKKIEAYWEAKSDEFYKPYVAVVPVDAPSLYGQKHKRYTVISDMKDGQPQRRSK